MIMIMARCQARGNNSPIPPAQHLLDQPQPDLAHQLWHDLALSKALHQMVVLHAVRLAPAHNVCPHIPIDDLCGTPKPKFKTNCLGFLTVHGISLQLRPVTSRAICFFLILCIPNGLVQSIDRNRGCVRPYVVAFVITKSGQELSARST